MILLAACGGPEEGSPAEPPRVECALEEANALRGTCEVQLPRPGLARVVLEEPGEAPRLYRSEVVSRVHRIPVWGLPASTSFRVRAIDERSGAEAEADFATGRLPERLRGLALQVQVAEPERAVEAVLFAPSCMPGVLWMVDRRGRFVWWQELHEGVGSVSGLAWTEDGTALALVSRGRIVEVDPVGEVLLDLRLGEDFDDPVHHDVFRKDGHTYVPHSYRTTAADRSWVADGIYVFGPDGSLVDDLLLDGVFPRVVKPWMESGYWIREFPEAVDLTHVNAIHVDPSGDLWVSMRHLSAVARFSGGPGEPGFGELELVIAGEEESPLWRDADLRPAPEEAFSGQHDPHPGVDGSLWLFDNRMLLEGSARAVRYALDEGAGALVELESWDTGLSCPVQGTARELPNGGVVATCASAGAIFEFAPGRPDPVWLLEPRCGGGAPQGFSRAVPVDLP